MALRYKVRVTIDLRRFSTKQIDEIYVPFTSLTTEQRNRIQVFAEPEDAWNGFAFNRGNGFKPGFHIFPVTKPRNTDTKPTDASKSFTDLESITLSDDLISTLVDALELELKTTQAQKTLLTLTESAFALPGRRVASGFSTFISNLFSR